MGPTSLHLNDSITRAVTYGKDPSSSKSGSRSCPMTESISCCAFFCASGFNKTATMNAVRVATVCFIRVCMNKGRDGGIGRDILYQIQLYRKGKMDGKVLDHILN